MKPHLVRWQKDLAEKGLVVLDLYDETQGDTFEDVKKEISKYKFPVLFDRAGKNTRTYGVEGFPSAYLVGVDGKVIWEGVPNSKIKEIEALMERELAKVKK